MRGHERTGLGTARARRLRRDSTDAERKLWSALRSRQLTAFKFRRQQPIGPYIVDFVCVSKRLVVELDGGQHAMDIRNDIVRTRHLHGRGFRVVRFWNNDVLKNTEGVKTMILAALNEGNDPPHPAR